MMKIIRANTVNIFIETNLLFTGELEPLELDRSQTVLSLSVSHRKSFTNMPFSTYDNLSCSYSSSSKRVNTGNDIFPSGSVTSFKVWLDTELKGSRSSVILPKRQSSNMLRDMKTKLNDIEEIPCDFRDSPMLKRRKLSDNSAKQLRLEKSNISSCKNSSAKLQIIDLMTNSNDDIFRKQEDEDAFAYNMDDVLSGNDVIHK